MACLEKSGRAILISLRMVSPPAPAQIYEICDATIRQE